MLYNKLIEYSKTDMYPMHMPGHKRNKEIVDMINPYDIDITEIDDFDDMHHARGIIKDITDRANKLYDAKDTYISVNGSSAGLLASISACTDINDKILVARNSHKSVYNAVLLRNLEPVYVYPRLLSNININGAIECEDIVKQVETQKDIKAVVITSPTYEGIISDIKKISDYLHSKNIPLIVDSAHGAHMGIFHNGIHALWEGADIVVQSLHKTLPAMTQTALVCVGKQSIVDSEKVKKYMSIYQSSSPSYVLMSSIDKCIQIIKEHGQELYDELYQNLSIFYEKSKKFKNIKILQYSDMDITKLVIIGDGYKIYNLLREQYHIQLEMKSINYALAMTSICDTKNGLERLYNALEEIDEKLESNDKTSKEKRMNLNDIKKNGCIKTVIRPCEVEKYDSEKISIEDAEGKISYDFVYLYPPDIPIVVPGERVSKQQIECIKEYIKEGFVVEGIQNFKVVKKDIF